MKKIIIVLLMFAPLLVGAQTNRYVAVDGNDSNPGTISQPFATWQRGFTATNTPGDTLFIRGGVYMNDLPVSYDPDRFGGALGGIGTYENPIVIMGYPGEWPILDCTNHCDNIPVNPHAAGRYNSGIGIQNTEYIHFKDFEIRNVFQCDAVIDGGVSVAFSCNLTFEHIIVHNVGQRGFYVSGGVWTAQDGVDPEVPIAPSKWGFGHPDTMRYINVDVYNLADSIGSTPGNAADGYKISQYAGNVSIWEGCRVWNYTDDAYDPTSKGAVRIFRDCWAMPGNVYDGNDDTKGWDLERNGFKLSGPNHGYEPDKNFAILENCVMYDCDRAIILMEYNVYKRINALIYNSTILNTRSIGIANWGDDLPVALSNVFKNNIIYGTKGKNASGRTANVFMLTNKPYDASNNTWRWSATQFQNFEDNPAYNVTDADFVSLDHETVFAQLTAPRKPDGSLPDVPALQLVPGSDFIDGGIDVGLPYYGSAPDLGAFEYNPNAGTPPTALFTATPTIIDEGQSVSFDASGSTDADGVIVSYAWNFGNGTGTGVTTTRTYNTAGTYNVVLTITDNDNYSASTNQTITVNALAEPNDSILVHNATELVAAMNAPREPGDVIWVKTNTITGNVNFNTNGTSVNHITIAAHKDFTPIFNGKGTVTGLHITLSNLTFNNGLELTSFDTDVVNCNINSTLTLNYCTSPYVSNCTFTATGTNDVIVIIWPYGRRYMRNWTIDNNIYNIAPRVRFAGLNRSEWRMAYPLFDKNSVFNINQ